MIKKIKEDFDMELKEAMDILYTIARGIDPRYGKPLDIEDVCNDVEVVRALYLALSYLNYNEQEPSTDPYFRGKRFRMMEELSHCDDEPWDEEMEEMLARMLEDGYGKRSICQYFERSEDDIAEKLIELGLIKYSVQFTGRR